VYKVKKQRAWGRGLRIQELGLRAQGTILLPINRDTDGKAGHTRSKAHRLRPTFGEQK